MLHCIKLSNAPSKSDKKNKIYVYRTKVICIPIIRLFINPVCECVYHVMVLHKGTLYNFVFLRFKPMTDMEKYKLISMVYVSPYNFLLLQIESCILAIS